MKFIIEWIVVIFCWIMLIKLYCEVSKEEILPSIKSKIKISFKKDESGE